jgi:hypothetical protein
MDNPWLVFEFGYWQGLTIENARLLLKKLMRSELD